MNLGGIRGIRALSAVADCRRALRCARRRRQAEPVGARVWPGSTRWSSLILSALLLGLLLPARGARRRRPRRGAHGGDRPAVLPVRRPHGDRRGVGRAAQLAAAGVDARGDVRRVPGARPAGPAAARRGALVRAEDRSALPVAAAVDRAGLGRVHVGRRGNVAGAITGATISNVVGIVLTPLLVGLLHGADHAARPAGNVGGILLQLLLPFAVGQVAQRVDRPLGARRTRGSPG